VPGVHVGLDLEDERGERRVAGIDAALDGHSRLGRRRQQRQCLEKAFDAEVVQGAAEIHRCEAAFEERRAGEGFSRGAKKIERLLQPLETLAADRRGKRWILDACLPNLRFVLTSRSTTIAEQAAGREVEYALKIRTVANRPVHRRGPDAQDVLDFIEQLERVPRRLIHLVDERQDRDLAVTANLE
jgi:hypothetical protein